MSVLKEDIKYFLEINVVSTNRLATVWDALKAFVRGKCIAFSSKKVKENKAKIQTLEERIGTLEKQIAGKFDDSKFKEICQLKFSLHEIYNKKAEYALFRLKTNFYENGEKTGRLLARQCKKIDNQNVITAIKKDDTLVTYSSDINMAFKMFYQDLYTSENMVSEDRMDAF